jgi:5-methylcytosine-specific restriction endonuclease McrA
MAEVYIPIVLQREIVKLSNDYCEYRLYPASFSSSSFHFDHIIPVAKDGKTMLGNLARSCAGCNGFKQDKTHHYDPFTHQICRLYNPR